MLWQTSVALVLVGTAGCYLAYRAWRAWKGASAGCACAGACASGCDKNAVARSSAPTLTLPEELKIRQRSGSNDPSKM